MVDIQVQAIIGLLLFLFFIPPAWIIFRNTKFVMPLRIIFSITFIPILAVLIIINYWFVTEIIQIDVILVHDSHMPMIYKSVYAVMFFPLPVLGCYSWFKLFSFLNSKLSNNNIDQIVLDKTELSRNASQAVWIGLLSIAIIISIFLSTFLIDLLMSKGVQTSARTAFVIYLILPAIVVIAYIVKRHYNIDGGLANTDSKNHGELPSAKADSSVSSEKEKQEDIVF